MEAARCGCLLADCFFLMNLCPNETATVADVIPLWFIHLSHHGNPTGESLAKVGYLIYIIFFFFFKLFTHVAITSYSFLFFFSSLQTPK